MIRVTESLAIPETEIVERFVRAPGPGGQNVNKLATAVELRFDAAASASLTPEIRARLERLAGRRMTAEGVLVLFARRFRTQEANRRDARSRFCALLAAAAEPPRPRRATRPGRAAAVRRLAAKKARAARKAARRPPEPE